MDENSVNQDTRTGALETTDTISSENQENGKQQKSFRTMTDKKQQEIEMAKEYQKVTRNLAREISKKDGFSLVTQTDEAVVDGGGKVPDVTPEPSDGLLTETTFKSATSLLLALEV